MSVYRRAHWPPILKVQPIALCDVMLQLLQCLAHLEAINELDVSNSDRMTDT